MGSREASTYEYIIVTSPDGTKHRYGPEHIASLRAKLGDDDLGQPLPLARTDVDGRVTLNLASVTVTHRFENPYASKIEAVYVFPLPQDAAISDFVMQIGDRQIRGIVREREEAQRIYEAARAAGHRATLLSQDRPNVFTQSVANIEPGQRIDVATTYFQTLPWRDGAFEMVVPTVVGPRFNPAGSVDGVGAVAASHRPGTSGQATEVGYLQRSADAPHVLGLKVHVDARMPLGDVTCDSHPVTIERPDDHSASLALRRDDVPNRDFVLRFAPKGDGLHGAVAVHRDPESGDGWFTMLVQPPADPASDDIEAQPREMVFVIDCSGSMRGEPLAACKRTIRRCLDEQRENDTLRVIRFSDQSSALGADALPATPDNVRRALAYVDGLEATGGTMMEQGIRAALQPRSEPGRRRIVTFLTDGYIGNERDILRAIHQHVGDARIFSFGIGSSPNRYLLERMARIGRGVAAFVDVDDSSRDQVDALFRRIEKPALADLRIDWQGADVHGVEPARLPDALPGRPILIHGRVRGALPASIRLTGRAGNQERSYAIEVGEARTDAMLPKLWARARIRTLHDARNWVATPDELADEIRGLALEYGLASDFTSFLAVDASEVTAGDHGTTLRVPAPMPRGVRYDTTISGSR